jgi:hypothetical protein
LASEKKWSGRAFISLCSTVSFVLLVFTGIILYVEPQGRVAYWVKWDFLSLEKDQWGNIHLFSGPLFLIAGGFHIYYNWKPLMKYLSAKVESSLRYKREILLSAVILIWILISGIWSLPPLVYIAQWGQGIKDSWVTSPDLEPPFGHAELASLKVFCKKQQIPLDAAMAELRKAGFSVDNPQRTLAEIAQSKNAAGMSVYTVIKKLEAKPEAVKPGATWTAEKIEETFTGTGLGQKTVGQIIDDLKLAPDIVYKRLELIHIEAKSEDRLKNLAEKHNTTPIKILTAILVEDGQLE